jgi:hypothetical protein
MAGQDAVNDLATVDKIALARDCGSQMLIVMESAHAAAFGAARSNMP